MNIIKKRPKGQAEPGETSYNCLYSKYRDSAKRRKHVFNIDKQSFKKIISQDCFYCGERPRYYSAYTYGRRDISDKVRELAKINVNGIDRLDNKKGYIKDNCIPCCTVCNNMKHGYEIGFFIRHILKIGKHLCKKNFKINTYF